MLRRALIRLLLREAMVLRLLLPKSALKMWQKVCMLRFEIWFLKHVHFDFWVFMVLIWGKSILLLEKNPWKKLIVIFLNCRVMIELLSVLIIWSDLIQSHKFLTASTVVIGVLEMTLKLVGLVLVWQELLSRLALAMTLPKSWKWHCQSLVKRRARKKTRPREGAPARRSARKKARPREGAPARRRTREKACPWEGTPARRSAHEKAKGAPVKS